MSELLVSTNQVIPVEYWLCVELVSSVITVLFLLV